ncbi:MAG: hypothetical protein ACKOUM_06290, partial [Sphingopyxis sp.]
QVDASLAALDAPGRDELRHLGVRVGTLDLYHGQLTKPKPMAWLCALDAAWRHQPAVVPPAPGIGLVAADGADQPAIAGFRRVGAWWLRIDLVERIAKHAHTARRATPPTEKGRRGKTADANGATPAESPVVDAVAVEGALVEATPVEAAPNAVSPGSAPGDAAVTTDADAAVPATAGADELSLDAGQPQPPAARRPDGAFAIDPELARSIGLPLADRMVLLRQLGFRTTFPSTGLQAEDEAGLWWVWRGRNPRSAPHGGQRRGQRGAQSGAQDRRGAQSGATSTNATGDGTADNARARRTKTAFGGRDGSGGNNARGDGPRGDGPRGDSARRDDR